MKRKVLFILLILLLGATTLVNAQSGSQVQAQVVRQTADLLARTRYTDVGDVQFWNTRNEFKLSFELTDGWLVRNVYAYSGEELPPTYRRTGKPIIKKFNCIRKFRDPVASTEVKCNLKDELDFTWGGERNVYSAVYVSLVKENSKGKVIKRKSAWAYYEPTAIEWKGRAWGWYWTTAFTHPARGHFIDSPVGGAKYGTPTQNGKTDLSGGFDYFPGEEVEVAVGPVALGSTVANHKISPLDLFESADIHDSRVINMARFLQSLDADADPQQGIDISDDVLACLDYAYANSGLTEVDFSEDAQVEGLILDTIAACEDMEDVTLALVSAEDAKENLDKSLSSDMFRKNISRSPELASSKSKLNIMGMWFPAVKADGTQAEFIYEEQEYVGIPYYYYDDDYYGDDEGRLLLTRIATQAKPVVVVYTDGVEETGYEDIFAGISRDDGNTFKRMNLSRAADKSSFELADGSPYYGAAKKPVFHVKGNNILVTWTSKFCKGGKPTYAIETAETDPEDDYAFDDPYYEEDIWGVGGPQRSVDYTEQGFPEVGEVPYSCVWVARGTVVTQGMINSGGFWVWTDEEAALHDEDKFVVGDIVWFKPERLTSGRRDANQIFMGGADGAGFAIAWQEDPEGLRPGDAAGPGPGWGGATTNHKTDIWYSYITMGDFNKVDLNFEEGGDPEHDLENVGRPKALIPMSLPVRLSDNDVVNTDNLMVELGADGLPVEDEEGNWIPISNPETSGDGSGSHAYGYAVEGLCEGFYEFTNNQDEVKNVCITGDGRLLDGDTGASRPNLFLQTRTLPDGVTKSAWAIMAYEETKGVGGGAPDFAGTEGPHGDEYVPDEGKNVIYHSFDFQNPPLVSAGGILNLPERDDLENLLYLEDEQGVPILDWQDRQQLTYENARRPRFILQGRGAVGASQTPLIVVYKEGQEGQGRPSDIMLRRFVASGPGNPYGINNLVCDATTVDVNDQEVCIDGAQNMSSVEIGDTWINPDRDESALGDGVKVVTWTQSDENLDDPSWANPYDDARAHRGQIRGDFVVMGFSYTANWAAARNGHDRYDFFVRRSFDGGQTWRTDPAGDGVEHCITWNDPRLDDDPDTDDKENKITDCQFFGAGEFERMRNLSQLTNNKSSVIEPRIVSTPGTIKKNGVWTGIDEDKQNPNIFYVSYGTSTNPGQIHGDSAEEPEFPAPLDLYYSLSTDRGETYELIEWDVNPDSSGQYAGETVTRWDYMAKGDPEQGEAQLRMTPDGTRFYATWLQEGEEGSDIWFRRILSPAFPINTTAMAE